MTAPQPHLRRDHRVDGDPPPFRQALALIRDAIGTAPGSFVWIVALSVCSALLESASLLLLPLLLGGSAGLVAPLLAPAIGLGTGGLAALYLGAVLLAAAALHVQTLAADDLTRRFGERLRVRLHSSLLDAAWGSPALARPADNLHALTSEANQSAHAVQLAIGMATRLITLPALAAAAMTLSPGLTLAAGGLALVLGLPTLHLARRAYRSAGAMAGESRTLTAELSDELAGLKSLKLLRAEPARRAALAARLASLGRMNAAMSAAAAAVRSWQRVATALAVALGAGYGLVGLGLEGARMIALALAIVRLAAGTNQLLDQWRIVSRLLPAYQAIRTREAGCAADREPAPVASPPRLTRSLSLREVCYTHPGADGPILQHIDLDLVAGTVTALVGPSGAGKSTLADLAMGLIAPSAGRILIDGEELDPPARVAWRARIAYVPQDGFLFHDTVRANLRLAAPAATDAEMHRALDQAAAGFVRTLPDGLDTVVGARGSRLSGGERQRVMIARALLQDPDLLVLDEATSALDPDTEAAVLAALAARAARTTVLVIAHRSEAIAIADRVVRLAAGRIQSKGTSV